MKAAIVMEAGRPPVYGDFKEPVPVVGIDGVGQLDDGRRVYFVLPEVRDLMIEVHAIHPFYVHVIFTLIAVLSLNE